MEFCRAPRQNTICWPETFFDLCSQSLYRYHLKEADNKRQTTVHNETAAGEAPAKRRYLLCRVCLAKVCADDARIAKEQKHEHTFFNPHGVLFQIGCFRSAPGLKTVGLPTGEFSWFAGYLWQFAVCRQCGEHIGWYYSQADAQGFFGLILDRLIEQEGEQSPDSFF